MARYALSWSGGKDSTLALDRACRQGLDVSYLFNIYEGSSGRVRFHGVRSELIAVQAESLGITLLQAHTHPDNFETVFCGVLDSLRDRGVEGIIFGNIHLADIRAWYEERTRKYGFEHLEPLWGDEPGRLINEFIERGYRSRIVGINLALGDPAWLGVDIDHAFVETLKTTPDVDLCGERGEYHSFAYDGPLFQWPVGYQTGHQQELDGHRFLDLAHL